MKQRLKRIFGLLFILVNIASLAIVSSTNSKYLKEDNIAYDTSMYKYTPTMSVVYVNTTNDGANLFHNYRVSFSRNYMNYPGESDLYTFYARINNLKNTCTTGIDDIYKSPTDTGMGTIPVADSTTIINIDVSCNITDYADGTPIYFHAEEKIGNDEPLLIDNVTKYISNYDLYSDIIQLIESSSYSDEIKYSMRVYLGSVIKSNIDLHNGNQLKGLTYDLNNPPASLSLNYAGYAHTYTTFKANVYQNVIYFPSIDEINSNSSYSVLDDYDYYLKNYYGFDDNFINATHEYLMAKTGKATAQEALLYYLSGSAGGIPGYAVINAPTPLKGIRIYYDRLRYLVNIAYNLDNYFGVVAENGTNFAGFYNNYVSSYNLPILVGNTTLRDSFVSIDGTASRLYVVDNDNGDSTTTKLLVNIYQGTETLGSGDSEITYTLHYMRVMKLEEGATIKISNNATYSYNNLNDSTTLSDLNDIVDAINTYSGYTLTLVETGEDYITYTLMDPNN